MSGRRSRDKGARTERAIVHLLQASGIEATKISSLPGADLRLPILGVERAVDVKCRAAGFRSLYEWLSGRDVLIVKADRQEPLVVLRMSVAVENRERHQGGRKVTNRPTRITQAEVARVIRAAKREGAAEVIVSLDERTVLVRLSTVTDKPVEDAGEVIL